MGVIKRQGAKHSSVRVASVMLGAFSSLFIYPLDLSTYGTLVFLLSFASFLHYPLTLGFGQTMVKFFHEFELGVKKSSFFFHTKPYPNMYSGYNLLALLFLTRFYFKCIG